MSTQVFPILTGKAWDVVRTPIWETIVQENVSGKEVRLANFTYPRYQWDLTYSALRQGSVNGANYTEFAQVMAFYNARQGSFDSFLYTDDDDQTVTGQAIGVGDGVTTQFQMVRSLPGGAFVEPVLAPNTVTAIKLNGTPQTLGTAVNVASWGQPNPGVATFVTPPASGVVITADFTYYWPVRFLDDQLQFTKFISNMYAVKKLSFKSVKN